MPAATTTASTAGAFTTTTTTTFTTTTTTTTTLGDATAEDEARGLGFDLAVVDAALAGRSIARVDLTGGEPLSEPGIFDVIARVRKHGAMPAMVTDGAAIDGAAARDLRRAGVALVQPTVLSTDREVHARLKGSDTLDATIHAVALLRREGIAVSLAFICTSLNHDHLDDVVRLGRALDVASIAFSRLCTTGAALHHRDEIWPDQWMVRAGLARLRDLEQKHGVDVHNAVAVPHCVSETGGRCSVVAESPSYTIDAAGLVRPCAVSSVVLGSVFHSSWREIDARCLALARTFRDALPEPCRRCERLERCGGGCLASALDGGAGGRDPLADAA
jgi:pyrroloquinoline quinone biosynthesis protein E